MKDGTIVDKVSTERWKEAQNWENDHWIRTQNLRGKYFKNQIWTLLSAIGVANKYRGDDWNTWWKHAFANYSFLPSSIGNAIELGCGPYTNIQHMLDGRQIDHLFLSDPLIRTYAKFKKTFVAEQYHKVACILDDHPTEELPFATGYFNLVVMINVLDHVRDAEACMESVLRITKPGGFVVIGQDLTNERDLNQMQGGEGEIGHPIKLDNQWFDRFLGNGFEPHIYKVLSREEGRAPKHHYGTLLFAGKKGI